MLFIIINITFFFFNLYYNFQIKTTFIVRFNMNSTLESYLIYRRHKSWNFSTDYKTGLKLIRLAATYLANSHNIRVRFRLTFEAGHAVFAEIGLVPGRKPKRKKKSFGDHYLKTLIAIAIFFFLEDREQGCILWSTR